MTDEQDRAEALDDDVLADDEDVGVGADVYERAPALDEDFPPDEPWGVADAGRFEIEDDLATRETRTEPEE
jgi:hypothetical protein